MKRKLLAFLITIVMLAGTYGMIPVILAKLDNGVPKASRGVLDLSHWDFTLDGPVRLAGEWEFYPDRLLEPRDFTGGNAPSPQTIPVPGSWSNTMDPLGKATYRLRVNVSDGSPVYGLKTLSIQMSARIFVNGQEIGASGNPSGDPSYYAVNKPIVGYFTLRPGLNELIVHVANYDFPASSGINHGIYLGYSGQMTALHAKALAHDWITVTSVSIMGLYFGGLYTQRRKDYSLLIFGLLCFLFAIYSTTRGERILYDMFGHMPAWLFLRVQYVSTSLAGVGILLYVYTAFRPFCSKRLVHSALVVGAVLAVAHSVFFMSTHTKIMQVVTTLYASLPFLYAMYVFLSAALHRVEGSLYLAIATIALNMYAFVSNMNVYFGVPVYIFPPVELILFLLMLALLMSHRFSNAFKQNEQLSESLVRADKLKDEFLTKTAHEFKTPLHGMMNIAQSMIDDTRYPLTAEQKENAGLISATAKRLSQLVYDILDFSLLKEGEMKVNPAPVEVRSTVGVTLKVFSFLTEGKDVRLVNGIPRDLPFVLADEIRFRQIIFNLLDNAVKHTQQGSIEVSASQAGDKLEISVSDTGEGIGEDDIPVIFEPFKSMTADSGHSFGLGLSIVKQLVELQKGDIRVTSKKNSGTVFTFSLPIAKRTGTETMNRGFTRVTAESSAPIAAAYSFPTPYVTRRKGTYTILAVDDHFSNLKVLIDTLERDHYTVIAVKNGYEALQQIESVHSIDLVILDLMMPGLSGFEVCRAIRRKYNLLELPLLMVTASIQPEDKIAAFDAGANDYLPKPFDTSELKARVKSLLVMKESVGKAVDMEVAFLQSQIKPHFLFNVLNTIMALSYKDTEQSRKLTGDLADYLRGSFSFSNIQKGVPFSSELALIRSYVEIERARFKDRIHVEYDIAAGAQDVKLPPLLIQPLVENAIRHGIANRHEGGTVRVRAYEEGKHYIFEIEDNGVGMANGLAGVDDAVNETAAARQPGKSGVGLRNIRKRLKYAYSTDLSVESKPGMGTKVTVRIPVESV